MAKLNAQVQGAAVDQALVAAVTQAVMAAMGKSVVTAAQGTATAAVVVARKVQAISWFVSGDKRATKPEDLGVKGHAVGADAPRTQLLTLNTGTGRFGMEAVYVPKSGTWEAVLEALRKDDVPVSLHVGSVKIDLVRGQQG